MSELKTLKDLIALTNKVEFDALMELKQEAIKCMKDKNIRTTWSAEEFIEYFFNLTEDCTYKNNENSQGIKEFVKEGRKKFGLSQSDIKENVK